MIFKFILIGLLGYIATIDERVLGASMMNRPIILGPLVGLILGDLQTGIIVGATLETMFIGTVTIGAALPPDVGVAGVLCMALAILTDTGADVAVTLALPFAILAQGYNMLVFTINSYFVSKGIKSAGQGDTRSLAKWHFTPLLVRLPIAILCFLVVFLGTDAAKFLVELLPEKVMNGFSVAAGLLPAVGFAMLVQMMISKKLAPFFFIGFMLSTYLKMDVIGVSVLAVLIVLIILSWKKFVPEEG